MESVSFYIKVEIPRELIRVNNYVNVCNYLASVEAANISRQYQELKDILLRKFNGKSSKGLAKYIEDNLTPQNIAKSILNYGNLTARELKIQKENITYFLPRELKIQKENIADFLSLTLYSLIDRLVKDNFNPPKILINEVTLNNDSYLQPRSIDTLKQYLEECEEEKLIKNKVQKVNELEQKFKQMVANAVFENKPIHIKYLIDYLKSLLKMPDILTVDQIEYLEDLLKTEDWIGIIQKINIQLVVNNNMAEDENGNLIMEQMIHINTVNEGHINISYSIYGDPIYRGVYHAMLGFEENVWFLMDDRQYLFGDNIEILHKAFNEIGLNQNTLNPDELKITPFNKFKNLILTAPYPDLGNTVTTKPLLMSPSVLKKIIRDHIPENSTVKFRLQNLNFKDLKDIDYTIQVEIVKSNFPSDVEYIINISRTVKIYGLNSKTIESDLDQYIVEEITIVSNELIDVKIPEEKVDKLGKVFDKLKKFELNTPFIDPVINPNNNIYLKDTVSILNSKYLVYRFLQEFYRSYNAVQNELEYINKTVNFEKLDNEEIIINFGYLGFIKTIVSLAEEKIGSSYFEHIDKLYLDHEKPVEWIYDFGKEVLNNFIININYTRTDSTIIIDARPEGVKIVLDIDAPIRMCLRSYEFNLEFTNVSKDQNQPLSLIDSMDRSDPRYQYIKTILNYNKLNRNVNIVTYGAMKEAPENVMLTIKTYINSLKIDITCYYIGKRQLPNDDVNMVEEELAKDMVEIEKDLPVFEISTESKIYRSTTKMSNVKVFHPLFNKKITPFNYLDLVTFLYYNIISDADIDVDKIVNTEDVRGKFIVKYEQLIGILNKQGFYSMTLKEKYTQKGINCIRSLLNLIGINVRFKDEFDKDKIEIVLSEDTTIEDNWKSDFNGNISVTFMLSSEYKADNYYTIPVSKNISDMHEAIDYLKTHSLAGEYIAAILKNRSIMYDSELEDDDFEVIKVQGSVEPYLFINIYAIRCYVDYVCNDDNQEIALFKPYMKKESDFEPVFESKFDGKSVILNINYSTIFNPREMLSNDIVEKKLSDKDLVLDMVRSQIKKLELYSNMSTSNNAHTINYIKDNTDNTELLRYIEKILNTTGSYIEVKITDNDPDIKNTEANIGDVKPSINESVMRIFQATLFYSTISVVDNKIVLNIYRY